MRAVVLTAVLAMGVSTEAQAGRCDGWLKKAERAKGDDLVSAYRQLAACDAEVGREQLWTFMQHAGTLDTLEALAIEGIRADAFTDLWKGMDELAYEQRAPLAEGIGKACADEPKVLTMLQAAYVALKGSAFSAWGPAMAACGSDEMVGWMEGVVTDPPKSEYNAQYNAMLTALVDLRGAEALPTLEKAAIAAADGGPLNNVLDMMQRAIQPKSMREKADPAAEQALAEALVRIANAVDPEPARRVADRLYTAGREAMAASLLPRVYPAAVGADGAVTWAAAAVERCEGKAVVHWTTYVESPPTHWAVAPLVETPLRGVKPKLSCDAGTWPVRTSDEPLADAKAAKDWAASLGAPIEAEGDKVKVVEEKKVF